MSRIKVKMLYPFIRFISKIEVKGILLKLYTDVTGQTEEQKQETLMRVFNQLIFILMDELPKAEKEFFEFMESYIEKPVEDIQNMDLFDLIDELKKLYEDERFKSFLELVLEKTK